MKKVIMPDSICRRLDSTTLKEEILYEVPKLLFYLWKSDASQTLLLCCRMMKRKIEVGMSSMKQRGGKGITKKGRGGHNLEASSKLRHHLEFVTPVTKWTSFFMSNLWSFLLLKPSIKLRLVVLLLWSDKT